jgi:N-methylhydantoinase B
MEIVATDGRRRVLRTFETKPIFPGEVCETRNAGGGGWGDPLKREPQRVSADVQSGFVSPARARDVYGVVLDAAGLSVDAAATQRQRDALRSLRAAAGAAN